MILKYRNITSTLANFTLTLFFILFGLFLNSCEETKKEKLLFDTSFDNSANNPDQIFKNFEVFFYDSTYKRAKLQAQVAKIYLKKKITFLDTNVYCEFYEKNDLVISSRLYADSCQVEDDTKNIYAYGNVIVKSDSSKTQLTTNLLKWDNEKQLLHSDKFVKINSPFEIIEGYGFQSNLDLSHYKIFKVSGQVFK